MQSLSKLPALPKANLFRLNQTLPLTNSNDNESSFISSKSQVPQSFPLDEASSSDSEEVDCLDNFDAPQRHNARITLSQLFTLYKEYEEYTKLKNEYPNAYKTGASIRGIAAKLRMAKSTGYFYFNKFRTNPYYISAKFLSYKNHVMQNARKGKPKYYPASDEEELVDWIYRNRQEGLTVTGDAIIAKAKEVINCPKVRYTRRWLNSFLKRNNLSFRKCTHSDKPQQFSQIVSHKIAQFHQIIDVFRLKFNYNNAFVINMDETPVFFDYNMKTVEEKGTKFVTRLQLSDEKRRITCVLTVAANGDVLRPMMSAQSKRDLEFVIRRL